MNDPYGLLKLPPTATPPEVEAAYARERARLIADSGEDPPALEQQLAALDQAYLKLRGPRRTGDEPSDPAAVGAALAVAPPAAPGPLQVQPPGPAQQACPHCGGLNPLQASLCAGCGQQVSRPCPSCGRPVLLGQTVCGRCGTYLPEYDQRRFAEAVATDQRVQDERLASDVRVQALEAGHRARAWQAAIFVLVALLLCGLVTVAAALIPTLLSTGR